MIHEDSRRFPTSSIGNVLLAPIDRKRETSDAMEAKLLRRRIDERLEATGKKPVPVALAIGKGRDYLRDFLKGKKHSLSMEALAALAKELGCPVVYFMDPNVSASDLLSQAPTDEVLIPIRGFVGASPDGRIRFSTGDATNDFALMPIGATAKSIALYVDGPSMKGTADPGSLVFYEETRSPPTPDMLGHVVVVETAFGDVLVKRLLKGAHKGVYDLESTNGHRMEDQRLRWAAHIISIIPPYRARQIIRKMAA